jgi:hypothetical protein
VTSDFPQRDSGKTSKINALPKRKSLFEMKNNDMEERGDPLRKQNGERETKEQSFQK